MSEHDPRLSDLYRRLASEEPSHSLDEGILEQGRAGARRHHRRQLQRRMIGLSTAALLVLGLSVTLKLTEQQATRPALMLELGEEGAATGAKPRSRGAPAGAGESELLAPPAQKALGEERAAKRELQSAPAARSDASVPAPPAPALAAPAGGGARPTPLEERVPMRRKGVAATVPAEEEIQEGRADAEQWLAEIEAIYARGEHGKAQAALRGFVAAYPNHPLPEPLRRLLEDEPPLSGN